MISAPITADGKKNFSAETAHIRCGVVRSKLPLLLSEAALVKMNESIHFGTNVLLMEGKYKIQLTESEAGNVQVHVEKGKFMSTPPNQPTKEILAANDESCRLTLAQLAKNTLTTKSLREGSITRNRQKCWPYLLRCRSGRNVLAMRMCAI